MIVLPERFEDILRADKSGGFLGAVNTAKSKFSEIFDENKLYFFEEFTDHGTRHINSVLEAAANLITADSYDLLTEKDIAILTLGIFLHDLGMHIQPLTFNSMVTGSYDDVLNNDFGDERWAALWQSYLAESRKFNDHQRENIFGDKTADLRIPPDLHNPDSLTGTHKKLIGEFIRRHHPRIAFEMAFKGLTLHSHGQIDICADFDRDFRTLGGLLARSHGTNLRELFSILQVNYDRAWRRPLGIHIIYLMTILRLADYFQIDSKRILKIPYKTRLFQSPVSFKEHEKHLQTKHIQQLDDDPETLFVTAEPTTCAYFLAIDNLFHDIQLELDQSWAVLGEIYGRLAYSEQPRLRYRRIRSNLDDKRAYSTKIAYVAEKISFVIDKEIPKLLVGPLYEYNPSCGVRELLQNAVDACMEAQMIEKSNSKEYSGEIHIKIEGNEDAAVFTITDNGKGMKLEEIKNYFLNIGGTFRKSEKWLSDYTDAEGRSIVSKSGRFGIGVLAAYLLGNEIEVETRSIVGNEDGYYFKTSLEQDHIEVIKKDLPKFGTTIRILLSKTAFNKLLEQDYWNDDYSHVHDSPPPFDKWYFLKRPKIYYDILAKQTRRLGYKFFLAGVDQKVKSPWHEVLHNDFKKIYWSYFSKLPGKVICNGILIPERYWLSIDDRDIPAPALVVYDFDAKLPISLDRRSIAAELPFAYELIVDIYKDRLAGLLLTNIKNVFHKDTVSIIRQTFNHPSTVHGKLIYGRKGFVPYDREFMTRLGGSLLTFFWNRFDKWVKDGIRYKIGKMDFVHWTHYNNMEDVFNSIEDMTLIGWSDNLSSYIGGKKKNRKKQLIENMLGSNIDQEVFVTIETLNTYQLNSSVFSDIISEYLGDDILIPYEIKDRKKKFPKAFDALSEYMEKYLKKRTFK